MEQKAPTARMVEETYLKWAGQKIKDLTDETRQLRRMLKEYIMSDTIDARVTVRFNFRNVCGRQDLEDCDMTLFEMVEMLIDQEGIAGVVDDEFELKKVEEIEKT